ncbi:hypothetical protein PO909_015683 [Leuciscus waleckii]
MKCGGRNSRVLHEGGFKTARRAHCALRNITEEAMLCQENTIHYCSWVFVVGGLLYLLRQMTTHTPYGRYVDTKSPGMMVPARAGWFIQELPSFLVPVLLFLTTESLPGIGRHLLLWTFCLHYFQRCVDVFLWNGHQHPQ